MGGETDQTPPASFLSSVIEEEEEETVDLFPIISVVTHMDPLRNFND
jgi:hypothetical protein